MKMKDKYFFVMNLWRKPHGLARGSSQLNPNIDTDDLISIKEDNIFINIPNERITYKIN